MKKIIFIISFLLVIQCENFVYATETNETMKEQEEILGISDFLQETEKYTKDTFTDTSLNTIYDNAISGEMDINGIFGVILKLAGDEILNTIKTLRLYINYYCNT